MKIYVKKAYLLILATALLFAASGCDKKEKGEQAILLILVTVLLFVASGCGKKEKSEKAMMRCSLPKTKICANWQS